MASSAWNSLVHRSLEAWGSLNKDHPTLPANILRSFASLEDFLSGSSGSLMFWFFQRREAFLLQKSMTKWSSKNLEDYIILPASTGFVTRTECFFVSHFWQTNDDPDPDGKYLRLIQENLQPQTWSYVWVDWSCIPQYPRTQNEETYFLRGIQTMSGIIRNSGFVWFYPPFRPRLWILYEVAEYVLTIDDSADTISYMGASEDSSMFSEHIREMLEQGVRPTLEKYGYICSYERDKEFLTSWLEVLVLLRKLCLDIDDIRASLDYLTWFPRTKKMYRPTTKGLMEMSRYEGTLVINGDCYQFSPFQNWVSICYNEYFTLC
ncbi:hypothetical protein Focb16_v009617 [Fusarium oxysporum f. sp. cubense]|uniref:Heterokaryon incompatibility domain-containing protein n=1 Tax=Fusarium oxysporum f. sp. cubense TaxID=61366 RepID=A0A559LV74_FUSOC|nr:hypothetical protein Focb16_v009617 [Fusarium oxysporum f. sp. cubense]